MVIKEQMDSQDIQADLENQVCCIKFEKKQGNKVPMRILTWKNLRWLETMEAPVQFICRILGWGRLD